MGRAMIGTRCRRAPCALRTRIGDVPYGPVDEVLPYLIRRAHENADALSGVPWQRAMILREVRRRLVGF